MKLILLFGLFPENYLKKIECYSKGNIQYAANVLQWNIVRGLDYFTENLKIINLPYIGAFPVTYKKIYSKGFEFEHKHGSKDRNIGFINIQYIKHYFRYISAKRALRDEVKGNNEPTTILIYSLNFPFLKAASEIKKKYHHVKICQITPDLPEFMSDKMNFTYRIFRKIDSKIIDKNKHNIDYFVFLTKTMNKVLNSFNKPYVVVEGIFNSDYVNSQPLKRRKKTILYTGTLDERYGIMNLIMAFNLIEDPEYRLWICGDGNTNQKIKEAARLNSRIIFWGLRPHNEVLEMQRVATLLVNPRTSEGEFTKYSFPSKTMEYLASGTPTLLYKLEGIPQEYYNFCYVLENETINALKDKIIEICNLSEDERNLFGKKAMNFIIDNKNPKVQCEKIYKMLND